MRNFFKHILTGKDNITYDLGRILWAIAFAIGISLATFCAFAGKPFDFQNYGLGVSALLVAGGAALKLKENTEPSDK